MTLIVWQISTKTHKHGENNPHIATWSIQPTNASSMKYKTLNFGRLFCSQSYICLNMIKANRAVSYVQASLIPTVWLKPT